jgi:hypothetical protein
VRGTQRGEYAAADLCRSGRVHRALGEVLRERAPTNQLHDDPWMRASIRIHDVMHGHHVRMTDPGQRPRLPQHSFTLHIGQARATTRLGLPHLLQRHLAL